YGNVLAGLVRSDRLAVLRNEVVGGRLRGFLYPPLDNKAAEAAPSPGLLLGLLVHVCFNADKHICNDPVSLAPRFDDLLGSRIAQYGFDRGQQVLSNDWI